MDKAASELQKIISDLQIHNDKLQQNIFNKDKIIEKLKDDLEKRQVKIVILYIKPYGFC